MDTPDRSAADRVRLLVVLAGLTMIGILAAATGPAEAAPVKTFRISPTSFDFGDVPVGSTSAQQTVTITNVSGVPVVMSGAGGGAGLFGGSQDCQGRTIIPGQFCSFFYAFTPAAIGPVTGSTGGSMNGQGFSFTFSGNGYNRAGISDIDADGKTDPAVYRPSTGEWLFLRSSTNYTTSTTIGFGVSTDRPVPGDYDGDGKIDLAVFRPSTGDWFVLTSSSNYTAFTSTQWGNSADVPVPGDYDGDGKTDIAVYRPSSGTWFMIKSSSGTIAGQWGNSTDLTVQADYDGDGKTDIAVYRPSIGTWFIISSISGTTAGVQWGNSTDVPIPADYDGDGKTDIAIFRPSSGTWFVINSGSGMPVSFPFGIGSDIPIPETYLGRWVP